MALDKALNRVTYGVLPEQLKKAEEQGWQNWLANQLRRANDDSACDQLINDLSYEIEYKDGGRKKKKTLNLFRYFVNSSEIWDALKDLDDPPEYIMQAGAIETALVTWTKAIHSQHQIFEMLVEFWHNHFNVSVQTEDYIAASFSIYDREVIRKNALGNFRTFTEGVAKSPCMLLYLDNAFSKSGPANENYARELFELHTLGAMHYYNHLYDDWKNVPTNEDGTAKGYIDEDIYEAARAFTGWTVGSGKIDHEVDFPSTGEFHYYDQWHDHYQKRVLGVEFKSHQNAMEDGLQVLDLVCYHKGTAIHLCTKLCQWFVSDTPSEALIAGAAEIWMQEAKADDQILKVVEFILLSEAFMQNLQTKIKRPNHLVFSLARKIGLEPSLDWFWILSEMGWKQFSWPLPTGHPDKASYWINSDMLLKRWNSVPLMLYLNMERVNKTRFMDETLKLEKTDINTLINYWSNQLIGAELSTEIKLEIERELLVEMEEMKGKEWGMLAKDYPDGLEYKLLQLVSMIALTPQFHKR
ncbi:MAG: hypothetical protein ACI8ZM_003950 [Crocinitomix sp.]|jgi:uncharacterized protein (DUF1800 family)